MSTKTSVRTFTKTTGSGENKVTTTVTEKTIIKPDGSKEVTTTETVQYGSGNDTVKETSNVTNDLSKLQVTAPANQPKSQPTKKVETSEELKATCLKAHNTCRQRHGAPPMTIAEDLCQFAQNWANHLASINTMKHSDRTMSNGDRLGENVFFQYPEDNSGHFTQMVWKSSTELGVGKAVSGDGKVYVVASYRPPGNYARQFQANVSRPN